MPPVTFDDLASPSAKPKTPGGAISFDDLAGPKTGYDKALTEERAALQKSGAADLPGWQGLTFGQGIDIDAQAQRASVLAQNIGRRMTGQPIPYSSDEAAKATEAGEREALAGFRQRRPVTSAAEEIGGGIVSPVNKVLAPLKIAETASMTGRVLKSALAGLGLGGLVGEGESGGDIKHRAVGAAEGGVFGGITGGVATASEPVFEALFRGANRLVQGAGRVGWQSAADQAVNRLRDALRQDKVDPKVIEAAIKEWKDSGAGAPKLLEVAGENTMGLIRAAASRFGPARNLAARNAMTERASLGATASDRAASLTPSEARSAPEVKQALEQERDALAEQQYRPEYAKPVAVTPALLAELRDTEGRQAINAAIRGARARKDYEAVKSLEALSGALDAKIDPRMPPALRAKAMEQYLAKLGPVTGAAVDKVRIALNAIGAQTKNPEMRAGFFDRANKIGDLLDDIPELKAARATYHAMSDKIRGLDIGQAALTQPASKFGMLLKAAGGKGKSPKPMTPEMLEQARTGARQWIEDELGKKPTQVRAALDKIAFGKDVRQNLEALFGKEEAGKYIRDAQFRIHRLTRAQDISPRSGSQTQPRSADAGAIIHGWRGLLSKGLDRLVTPNMDEKEAEALVKAALGDPSAMIPGIGRRPPVLRQALSRTAPVVSGQAARTISQPPQ